MFNNQLKEIKMSTEVKAPIDVVGLREELQKLTLDQLKNKFIGLGIESVYKNGANKQALIEKGITAYVELQKTISETLVIDPVVVKPEELQGVVVIETIPEGEYDIDEETLIDYPVLVERGFAIGDVLVVDSEGNWTNGSIDVVEGIETKNTPEDLNVSEPESPNFGTEGISTRKTIEEADAEIKKLNSTEETTIGTNKGGEHIELSKVKVNEELANLNGGSAPIETLVEDLDVDNTPEETTRDSEVSGEYVPEVIDETLYSEEDLVENIQICTANCSQAIPSTRIFLLRKIDALEAALERKRK